MQRGALLLAAGTALALASCQRPTDTPSTPPHGRYLGVGVFAAGQLWSKMAVKPPTDPKAATTADDEHVIVVVDSQTGELRECGDYSGVCASLNPWTRAIAPETAAPVKLTRHAANLAAEPRSGASSTH
jgi:hypothetical protein